MATGLVAFATARDTGTILGSNLVYRLTVGAAVIAFLYGVIAILWWAWCRRTFKAMTVAGSGIEAPDQEVQNIGQSVGGYEAMAKRAEHAEGLLDTFATQLKTTTTQAEQLLEENARLQTENERLRSDGGAGYRQGELRAGTNPSE